MEDFTLLKMFCILDFDPLDMRKPRSLGRGLHASLNLFSHCPYLQILYNTSYRKDLRSDGPEVTLLRHETIRPKEHESELTVKLSKANSGEEPTEAIGR